MTEHEYCDILKAAIERINLAVQKDKRRGDRCQDVTKELELLPTLTGSLIDKPAPRSGGGKKGMA